MWDSLVSARGTAIELFPEYDKLSARKLAVEAGVVVPRLIAGPMDARELRPEAYGDAFVIKPNWGASSRGVFVLRRAGKGQFLNLMDGATIDANDVQFEVASAIAQSGRGDSSRVIVEESVAPDSSRPVDWKIYSFFGETGIILQLDRSAARTRAKVWSDEWVDLGLVRRGLSFDSGLPAPKDPDGLVEAAAAISRLVPSGFVRVDLYETAEGAVAGELALIPGGDQFYRGGLDRRLGDLWEGANARLMLEGRLVVP